jgi:hypothetical protein
MEQGRTGMVARMRGVVVYEPGQIPVQPEVLAPQV